MWMVVIPKKIKKITEIKVTLWFYNQKHLGNNQKITE